MAEGGWFSGLGGLLGNAYDKIDWDKVGDYSAGLLANSGPSLTPQGGFGARLGKAGVYAGERENERIINDMRRTEMLSTQLEARGLAEMQKWMTENPNATDDDVMKAYTSFMPGQALKARMQNWMSPADRVQMQANQLQLLDLTQKIGEARAGAGTPSAATARAVGTLADVYDTAEKEGSPFAPGATFGSQSPLGKWGLGPETAVSLPDAVLSQLGDPITIRRQAAQAILIDKETATISQNLTQLAEKGTGRSATALNNLNTSLGAGNVPIPVRRKVILSTLETVIDDVTARGNDVPDDWYRLRDRLQEQTKNITKGGAEQTGTQEATGRGYVGPGAAEVPQLPSGFAPLPGVIPFAGGAVAPSNPSTTITPQQGVPARTPAPPTPIGPPPAQAAPAAPARKVGTLNLNAQGQPTFVRESDAQRAAASGLLDGYSVVIVGGKPFRVEPE